MIKLSKSNICQLFLFADKTQESKPLFDSAPFAPNLKAPTTNMFSGNAPSTETKTTNDTNHSAGFTFKLPTSTTLTPVTAEDSPHLQEPTQTSTPVENVNTNSSTAFGFSNNNTGANFADLAKSVQKPSEPLFSTSNNLTFSALAAQGNDNNTSEPHFPTTNNLTFSDLAKNTTAFSANQTSNSAGGFFGLSNKDTFSNLMQPKAAVNGSNASNQNDDNENADDANYDPHYDPIIALPDEIQVSTGEENEEKIFGEF